MTASAELIKHASRIEFVLLIEGIGWLVDEAAGLGSDIAGDVFATADLDGDLATQLGSGTTLHKGLMLPQSISDKVDPLTFAYEVGGMDFRMVDYDAYILENVTPHRTPSQTTVNTSFAYIDTELILDDGTDFATGDYAWLGGRELVKLGTKSGAGPHTYTGCTRGYLGTPRGMPVVGFPDDHGMAWRVNTAVHSVNRFLHNRRVRLYAHVPGEAASGMLLLYEGRVRGMATDCGGTEWVIQTAGEQVSARTRIRVSTSTWRATQSHFVQPNGRAYDPHAQGASSASGYPQAISESIAGAGLARVTMVLSLGAQSVSGGGGLLPAGDWNRDKYMMLSVYQYRSEPGGTAGAKANMFSTTPQGATFNDDDYVCESYLQVKDRLIRAIKKTPSLTGTERTAQHIMCDAKNVFGDWWLEWEKESREVKFLLDNITDDWKLSRFAINRMVRRNPIDVLLMFLTSMHDEFVITDNTGGGTTTELIVTNSALGAAADHWINYAVHCVEGSTNKGYSRRIIGSSTGVGNSLDLERALPGAGSAGEEVQIRNSIYDVLPIGWGLAIPNHRIDIDQFEYVRDRFLSDATLGKFVIGTADRTDLLDMLITDLCQSHNILILIGRDGRLTCRYMGEALGDGLIDDYVNVQKSDIIGEIGDLQYHIDRPIGSVSLKVRASAQTVVSVEYTPRQYTYQSYKFEKTHGSVRSPHIDGATTTIQIQSPELSAAYGEVALDDIEVSSMFNSAEDCGFVASLAMQRLGRYATAPPTISFRVGIHLIESVQAGTYLSLTHDAVIDPYDGSTGITNRACRVLQTEIVLSQDDPGLQIEAEILPNVAAAKIAPACEVVSKSSDANGQYLHCYPDKYTNDTDNDRDQNHFAVNDRVELRDKTGALKEDLGTITGFGDNFVSDPEDATDVSANIRVYVSDNSITSSIAVGDYITFKPYSASNTARMETYAAYADTAGALTGGDTAKEYG